ncbi:MAG: hypothetical protein HY721_20490 [Planctomycetes bacterium]|nr:hypothetical protein [Planctomycetota bacterium]
MSGVHIHLYLNHVAVLGTVFGLGLLVAAVLGRHRDFARAACVLFLVSAVAAGPVHFSGEAAEETVEGLPGVSIPAIEPHEDAAVPASIATAVLGAAAIAGLWLLRRPDRAPIAALVALLVLALATASLMLRAAYLGGKIRHPEVHAPAPEPGEPPGG